MTTRTWTGRSYNSWKAGANWSPAGEPEAGDTVIVSSNIASVDGLVLDDLTIQVGGTGEGTTGLQAVDSVVLTATTSVSLVPGGNADLIVQSALLVDGTVEALGSDPNYGTLSIIGGGTVTLGRTGRLSAAAGDTIVLVAATTNSGAITVDTGALFAQRGQLANDGTIVVSGGATFRQSATLTNTGLITVDDALLQGLGGSMINDGTITVAAGGYFQVQQELVNNGTVVMSGGVLVLSEGSTAVPAVPPGVISGNGTISLAAGGRLYSGGVISSGQQIAFLDGTGWLGIGNPGQFSATITGLNAGDVIDLSNSKIDMAVLDAGVLTASYQGAVVASLAVTAADGAVHFSTRDDGGFGTLLLTSNATRTWNGGAGSWYDAANWTTSGMIGTGAPLAGDVVTIDAGRADFDSSMGPLQAMDISLGGTAAAPGTLRLHGASIGYTTSIVVDGPAQHGRVQVAGANNLAGRATASSINGSLTFDMTGEVGAASPTLEIDGAVVAGQGAAVRFFGGTLTNNGLIVGYGRVDIASSVTLQGDGVIEIDHGGTVAIGGAVGTGLTVTFGDDLGRLAIADIGQFGASIGLFQQGDVIDLVQTVVTSLSVNGDVLTLGYGDGKTAILTVGTSLYNASPSGSFSYSSDGHGGTNILFTTTAPHVQNVSIPVAAVGAPKDQVSLRSILMNAFGTVPSGFASYTLSATQAKNDYTGYWGQPQQTPTGHAINPAWFVNGARVDGTAVTVAAADIDSVGFQVGNGLISTAYFGVTTAGTDADPIQITNYRMWSVAPSVNTYVPGQTVVSPVTEVSSIAIYNQVYTDVQNSDYCPWIADNAAAGMGGTMPWADESTDPFANEEGGFWRIVHNGAQTPVQDWYTLLQPGDVVRMGWAGADNTGPFGEGQHTTSIYQILEDGGATVAQVWDNNDYKNGGSVDYIGLHDATYWDATIPETITIYRLDPAHQYLIQGNAIGEFIQGSVFNNLIEPGMGADTITAGAGANEIRGTAAELDGDWVTDFHIEDWLDLTDLASGGAVAAYDTPSGILTVSSGSVHTTIQMPMGLTDRFTVASDGVGGTTVTLACYARGTAIAVPDGRTVAIEALAIGDLVMTASGAPCPVKWIGRRRYAGRFLAANARLRPVCFRAGSLGDGVPRRDLLVSPEHAMLLDGLLVPARCLVNGRSIVDAVGLDAVEYFHVELDRHDAILAEGAASETFIDDDSRWMFTNAHEFTRLYPEQSRVAAVYYAKRIDAGEELDIIRRAIDRRAGVNDREAYMKRAA